MTELTDRQRAVRRKRAHNAIEDALRATYSEWGTQTPPNLSTAADAAMEGLGELAAEILADGTMMRSLEVRDGVATLSLEPATEILKIFVASMRGVLDGYGAQNYLETEMKAPSVSMDLRDGSNPVDSYTVTIQRRQNPTPHELRQQAEARAEKAEAALAQFKGQVQAVADEARGGIRQQLGYILTSLDRPQAFRSTAKHVGNRANAEDCPGCAGTNPPWPFICPGEPAGTDDRA